jgi:hypothetical protein
MANTVEVYNRLSELIQKDYETYLNRHSGSDYFVYFEEFKQIAESAPLEVLNYNNSRLLFDVLNFAYSCDDGLEEYFTKYAILLIELGVNPFVCLEHSKTMHYKYRENNEDIITAIYKKYIGSPSLLLTEMLSALDRYSSK